MLEMITRIKKELGVSLGKTDSERSVVAIYLFGSSVRPEAGKKESDVDLAFLLDASTTALTL